MSVDVSPMETTFQTFPLPRLADVRPRVFVPRREIPKALLAAEATTYGWDTVNCVSLPVVNQVLQSSSNYPPQLTMNLNESENWTLTTDFGPWIISPGGSGAILIMKLPLTSATMTYGSNSLAFTNGYALISLKLRYVPQPPTGVAATDAPIDIEKLIAEAEARTPDDPAVVIQRINYGSATPTEEQKALFVGSISLLLNANLASFTHIFTVVNLNQKAAQKEFVWLKPTYTSYAYFQGLDDASSYFAVLNQTQGRSPEGLTNQVAASAIPSKMNASILISPTLFMQQFVLPGLPRAFTHASASNFKLVNLDQAIVSDSRIQLDNIRVGAIDYTPYMDTFRMQLVGDEVQINTKVSINISPGIDAYISATYYYVLGLVEKPDGTMTLDFEASAPPVIDTWYTVAFWVTLTQLIIGIIGAVIRAVVAELIEKVVVKVIVVALITIVSGVAAAIPSIIADVISNGAAAALPEIGPLIDEATDPVDWPKSSGFTLKTAELNGGLQFGGLLAMTNS